MNRLIVLVLIIFFLNQCSLNEKSRLWQYKEKKLVINNDVKKIFSDEKIIMDFKIIMVQ